MSFLARSNTNLTESTSSLFSRLDEKSKRVPVSQKTDLVGSLDDFRQGLRRQLTEKTGLTSIKNLEPPSPLRNSTIKDRLESFLSKPRASPTRSEIAYPTRSTSIRSIIGSEKKNDIVWDLNKKVEQRSSPRRTPTKDLSILSALDKKTNNSTSQSTLLLPGYRDSNSKRDRSPLNSYGWNIDTKTPDYRKTPQGTRSSFIDERGLNRTPNNERRERSPLQRKESLIKILDAPTIPQPQRSVEREAGKAYSGLTQQLNQLRASRTALQRSPERKEASSPTKNSSENLKSLSSFVSESFNNKYSTVKSNTSKGSDASKWFSSEGTSLAERLPISKLFEINSILSNASDKDFQKLSSQYVGELNKLSSVIKQRVKASNN